MARKINKKELELWKEITKDDIRFKKYLPDDMLNNENNSFINKKVTTKKFSDSFSKKTPLVNSKDIEKKIFNVPEKPQVNRRMKIKLERGLIRPEAFLDLHGYNRIEAEKNLKAFLNACIKQGKRCILVITGKRKSILGSKSILRELVPKWLNDSSFSNLILAHCYATKKDGGDGARYILIKKKETNQ